MRNKIKAALLAWAVAELIALIAAVRLLGWAPTILIGAATSAVGFYVLRQAGRDGMAALREAMSESAGGRIEVPSSGMLRIASGLLLVIPGFVSDALGLLLLVPGLGDVIARRLAPPPHPAADGVVDLDPAEWRARPESAEPSCEAAPGMLPGEPHRAQSRRRDDE